MCQEHCNCEQDMCHFEKGCKHNLTRSVIADTGYLSRPSESSSVLIIVDKSLGIKTIPVLFTISEKGSEVYTNRNIVKQDLKGNLLSLSSTGTISPMAAGIIGFAVVAVLLLFIYAGTFFLEESGHGRNTGAMEI
ncbi:uncharacterized protein LOC134276567 [Saccostrea cucullata]|uniref:uncharacterized protein LOC134276567 n=1 Tax=Saccostrea cuccullata TaxID=36930 RepID=UPI002ED2CE84